MVHTNELFLGSMRVAAYVSEVLYGDGSVIWINF